MSFDMKAWMNSHYGKFYDPDGVYGYQCVDLFKELCADLGMPNAAGPIGGDGWAHSIWYNRAAYSKWFTPVAKNAVQYGDVVIFEKGGLTPCSHVGICAGYNANGTMKVFGQNQGGPTISGKMGSGVNIVNLPVTTLLGGLRPKAQEPKEVVWNYEAALDVGDVVSSKTFTVTDVYNDGTVSLQGLPGKWKASELTESEKTQDGKNDQVLHKGSKVYFTETKVQDIDEGKNLVKINGYWIDPSILCRKEFK